MIAPAPTPVVPVDRRKSLGNVAARRRGKAYGINVALRAGAAIVGSYAVASLVAFACARLWPADRLQATIGATILAFLIVPPTAIWAFLAASPWRAWFGIVGVGAALALAGFGSGPHG